MDFLAFWKINFGTKTKFITHEMKCSLGFNSMLRITLAPFFKEFQNFDCILYILNENSYNENRFFFQN